ncbi:putative pentatricopeptide repeat-containing protein At5g06400, mitochondrial [Setaria italica]|uniref:putative pentatricopeptide repeat-containing protein At5g06400, mitochondrial n=1 Tax=Setaria italica TaxID=4555 RepID=UPI000BE522D0|nr:putative pentatricopeptide repeat-containing protein At5g06400, mitochondrial [Setaria italica]
MARSAATRLLACSARPFRPSHHHHRAPRPLFLLPNSRSKITTSSSNLPRPSPGREPGPSLFHEISDIVAPAVSGAALRPELNDEACRDDHGAAGVRCAEGARGIAPERATAVSSSVFCNISNTGVLGGLPDTAESAVNPDIDNISEAVHRITEALRSQAPRSSMEQRLESLGVTYTPELVGKVLKRCFKVRQLGFWFFHWVKRFPGFRHTTETYNTMLYITGEARRFDIMEELVGEMDIEMCPKDIKTWTIILSSYGKAGDIGKMLSTFEVMRKSGCIRIDSKVYRTVLHALCNAEKPELALEFYKDIPRNMEVGTDILRLLMCCLATTDNAVEAVCSIRDDLIKGMKHPEEYCYMEALRSFCISGKLDEAWKVFQHMKSKSMASSSAFENLLRGLCKAGKMAEALQIVEYMKGTLGINSTTFAFLINGYLRKGEHTKALDLLQVMREHGCVPLVSSYTQLMQHLFSIDQYEEACGLFEEMLKNGVEPDIVTLTALIGGHVRSGHISEAWDAFRNINKSGQKPTLKAYTVFIQELCKASRPLEAVELLKEMLESDFRPSDGTFCRIISALRDKFYLEEGRNVERMWASFNLQSPSDGLQFKPLDGMDTVDKFGGVRKSNPKEKELGLEFMGYSSDQNGKLSSFSDDTHKKEQEQDYSDGDVEEICQILSSSDDWGSMQQALEMRSVHFSPNLVDAILKRCKRNSCAALQFFSWVGKRSYYMPTTKTYTTAMKLAGSAKDFKHMRYLYREMLRTGCFPTVDTWNVMVCQYGNAGLSEKALKTFHEMKQHGFVPDKTTYQHLIMYLTCSKGRKVDVAAIIFKEMCHAGHIPDNDIVFKYLSALCECRKIVDARSSVVSLCGRGLSVQVGYSIFLRSLCRADRMEEALSLFDCIEKHGCSRDQYMYGSLIHALLRRDQFEDAVAKLTEMKEAGIPQSTHMYTSFIVYYFHKRDVVKALDVLKEMKENGCEPTVVTHSALIRGYMAMGMVSEAWDVFQQMKLKGPAPDFGTYSMFISCLCKAGLFLRYLQQQMLVMSCLATTEMQGQ